MARVRKPNLSSVRCRIIAPSQLFLLTCDSSANRNLPLLFTGPAPVWGQSSDWSSQRRSRQPGGFHLALALRRVVLIRAEGLARVANVRRFSTENDGKGATECQKVITHLHPAVGRGDGVYSKTAEQLFKIRQEPRTRTQVTQVHPEDPLFVC